MAQHLKTTRAGQAVLPSFPRGLRAAWMLVIAWQDRHRTRRSLGKLDAHMLRDIGLQPHAVQCECEKPFWRG